MHTLFSALLAPPHIFLLSLSRDCCLKAMRPDRDVLGNQTSSLPFYRREPAQKHKHTVCRSSKSKQTTRSSGTFETQIFPQSNTGQIRRIADQEGIRPNALRIPHAKFQRGKITAEESMHVCAHIDSVEEVRIKYPPATTDSIGCDVAALLRVFILQSAVYATSSERAYFSAHVT